MQKIQFGRKFSLLLSIYAVVTIIVIALKCTIYANYFNAAFFGVVLIAPVAILTLHRGGVSVLSLLFLFICFLSLVFNKVNPLFRAYERFALFLILFMGLGPLLLSERTNEFRYYVFCGIHKMFVVITLVSFIMYVFGRGYVRSGFGGIVGQPMDLAPIVALSTIYMINRVQSYQGWLKVIAVLFVVLGVFVLFLTASRGALGAFFVTALFLIVKKTATIKQAALYILTLLVVSLVLVIYNPMNVMTNLKVKFERIERSEDISGGRSQKTEKRLEEFQENPFLGVGFSTMRTLEMDSKGHFEPSNGWLFILSSTGFFGLLFSLLLFLLPLVRNRKNLKMTYLISSALFFMIHTLIEGYSITVGNPLCVIMWMNVALINKPIELYE